MKNSGMQLEVTIPNQMQYLGLIGGIGEQIGRELRDGSEGSDLLAYQLNLVLTEAISNAIRHGGPPDTRHDVRIDILADGLNLWVRVYDQGPGFDLDTLPLPDFDSLAEQGRGLFLIRELMDSVRYSRTADGNVLEMRKSLAEAGGVC